MPLLTYIIDKTCEKLASPPIESAYWRAVDADRQKTRQESLVYLIGKVADSSQSAVC